MYCLPNHTQSLLLKAALTNNLEEGYEALVSWQQATDFHEHIPKSEIRMIPMVWHKYKVQLAGNPLKDRFSGLYKKSFYTNSRLFHHLPVIVHVLENGKFNYAFTKGIALQYYLYNDGGLRPMNDLDILIEQKDFKPAITALKAIGYFEKYSQYTMDMYLSGEIHAYTLQHATMKDIDLHYFPTQLHNQKLTNQYFLSDASYHNFKGISIPLLTPEKLFLFILTNYQFTPEWHWVADVVLLYKKYDINLISLRPIVQQTGLYHLTHQQLSYLCNEYEIGNAEELSFYSKQPLLKIDKYAVESKHPYDLKGIIARTAGIRGMNKKDRVGLGVITSIIAWTFQQMKGTPGNKLLGKSVKAIKLLREHWLPVNKQPALSNTHNSR